MKTFSRSEVKKVKVTLIIFCGLYCYNSYSYSLEGAISCVQMCECYNGIDRYISTAWGQGLLVVVIVVIVTYEHFSVVS